MRRSPLPLILLLAITGCAVPALTVPGAGKGVAKPTPGQEKPAKAKDDPAAADPAAPAEQAAGGPAAVGQRAGEQAAADPAKPVRAEDNLPAEPLGGLTFKAIAPENARYAGGVGGGAPAAVPTSAGSSMAPPPMKGGYGGYGGAPVVPEGLTSGNMNGVSGSMYGYGYGGPMGMGGEPTALVSLTQSETAGAKGSYRQMMDAVVKPVIADWAADAQLLGANASTGGDGMLVAPSPEPSAIPAACMAIFGGSPYETGWRLAYYSADRREMLNFYVTGEKTLIIRARWAPLDLAAAPIAVDNVDALRALTAAIETKGFQAEEEKTGLDYFMGGPFAQPTDCFGPNVMPAGDYGPDDGPDDGPDADYASQYRTEAVYDVPERVRWQTNLQLILGKPVWELSYYGEAEPPRPLPVMKAPYPDQETPYEDPGFNFNNSARGLVDAATGAVIRFSRPSKHYYPKPSYYPPPYPSAYPSPYPLASAPPPDFQPPPPGGDPFPPKEGVIPTPAPTSPPTPAPSP